MLASGQSCERCGEYIGKDLDTIHNYRWGTEIQGKEIHLFSIGIDILYKQTLLWQGHRPKGNLHFCYRSDYLNLICFSLKKHTTRIQWTMLFYSMENKQSNITRSELVKTPQATIKSTHSGWNHHFLSQWFEGNNVKGERPAVSTWCCWSKGLL